MDRSTAHVVRVAVIPMSTTAVLALVAPLPLTWPMIATAACVLLVCVGVAVRRPVSGAGLQGILVNATAAATCTVAAIGAIVLGYAAFALRHPGVFGPITRLAYPFLVATGLRLAGGACLLLLCGVVSLIPAFVPDAEPRPTEDVTGAGVAIGGTWPDSQLRN